MNPFNESPDDTSTIDALWSSKRMRCDMSLTDTRYFYQSALARCLHALVLSDIPRKWATIQLYEHACERFGSPDTMLYWLILFESPLEVEDASSDSREPFAAAILVEHDVRLVELELFRTHDEAKENWNDFLADEKNEDAGEVNDEAILVSMTDQIMASDRSLCVHDARALAKKAFDERISRLFDEHGYRDTP